MSLVRLIISEHSHHDLIIRRYLVEKPGRHQVSCAAAVDELPRFDKLVELDLHLTERASGYFVGVPYALCEAVWLSALEATYTGDCFEPGYRFSARVLNCRFEAAFETLEWREDWGPGPVPIQVDLWTRPLSIEMYNRCGLYELARAPAP
ncbi:MAG: hypothetical protein RIB80_01075 [Rhodospirillales bacterium]